MRRIPISISPPIFFGLTFPAESRFRFGMSTQTHPDVPTDRTTRRTHINTIDVQLKVYLLPTAPRAGNPALFRNIARAWPGVPRVGDMVSLGGGDALSVEVDGVHWSDGGVRLDFLTLEEEDRAVLLDLGFAPSGAPEPTGGW